MLITLYHGWGEECVYSSWLMNYSVPGAILDTSTWTFHYYSHLLCSKVMEKTYKRGINKNGGYFRVFLGMSHSAFYIHFLKFMYGQ